MAPNDPWKRYFDAGVELTQLTRQRAERVVRDLIKTGEVQRDEAQDRVEELLERSRRSTEAVVELVRDEVAKQLRSLGLVSTRTGKSAGSATSSSSKGGTPKAAATTATKQAASTAKKTASTAKKATPPAAKSASSTAKKAAGSAKKSAGSAKKSAGTN